MNIEGFSFAAHAPTFDAHIRSSIPGYGELTRKCVELSRRFVQERTAVIDLGCSTGRLLASIRNKNRRARPSVTYIGIDIEPSFGAQWRKRTARDVRFVATDALSLSFDGFRNVSLACSLFMVQFVREADKMPLLRRVHEGLVEGGALIIAEKVLASTSRLQDALTFPYYDFKLRQGFSHGEILGKESELRGQMTLWRAAQLKRNLIEIGFHEVEQIWTNFPFVAYLALK